MSWTYLSLIFLFGLLVTAIVALGILLALAMFTSLGSDKGRSEERGEPHDGDGYRPA